MEPWVAGNVIAALVGNQSDPVYVASCLVMSCDLVQAVLHISGKALLLLG